jgi:hypothetical protein
MTKKLVKTTTTEVAEEKVLDQARELFSQMQKSWWEFAKLIYAIREGETFKTKGFDTFKEYCESDFPEMHYKTILKFCSIVENWGKSIESKIEKDGAYALPAYEACYAVISLKEDALPKEELSRLKRDVLEKKLSYHRLREKMKELLEMKRKETKDFIKKSKEDITHLERELEDQIGDTDEDDFMEAAQDEDVFTDFDESDLEDLTPDDFESDSTSLIHKTKKHCKDFSQTLEVLNTKIDTMPFNKELAELHGQLDHVYSLTDQLINTIQEMQ